MKQLMPMSPGGAGLQFIQLPGLPEVVTAQQAGQYFNKPPMYIGRVIARNPQYFEHYARRATDEETKVLKCQFGILNLSTRRANPTLITFEGLLLLAASMKNTQAVSVMLGWAESTGRIRRQQSLLLQEQPEGDAPMEQIEEPKKPKAPRPKMGRYEETPLTEGGVAKLMEETGSNLTGARGIMMAYAALHIDEVIRHIKYAAEHIDDVIAEYTNTTNTKH